MNRQKRRAAAAKARAAKVRHTAVADALAYIAARDDPTITGATLFLPDGEVLHLSAEAARHRPADKGDVH